MTDNKEMRIVIPSELQDRIYAELCKSVLSAPDYVQNIIKELMNSAVEKGYSSYGAKNYTFFEKIFRDQLTHMIEASVRKFMREKYGEIVDNAAKEAVYNLGPINSAFAYTLANMLQYDYKLNINIDINLEKMPE